MTKKRVTALLSHDLFNRVETYLISPVSVANNRSELVQKALVEYLDREEVIAEELEGVLMRIRKGLDLD
ncbi:MAG: hypothetical protein JRG71_14565 [Deltaproteobacteria bacterium]|nr:hypothetical protein [Deltaproteobacteria bacterium]